jgi:pimeloyl-ACP methyl ester carboxylesterase
MTAALSFHQLGSGAPMVLLPWFSLDADVMAAAFEPVLADVDGVQRTYVDLPGTGRSAPVAPRTDAVVEAVIELLEA